MFLLSRRRAAGRKARSPHLVSCRPQVEALEGRDLPSVGMLTNLFRVNTATTNSQFEADTASALNGRSVVVWTDKSASNSNPNIKAQRYDTRSGRVGGEITIAATSRAEGEPAVAMADDGRFVVVWSERLSATNR